MVDDNYELPCENEEINIEQKFPDEAKERLTCC
jgi:hypothetical protein